jgi:sterol desaturase/sphingolipid hydroxylase (fatty acid hydroxylase superfamily)
VDSLLLVCWRIGHLIPFLAAGFVLEELTQPNRRMPSSVLFNLCYMVVYWTLHVLIGVWLIAGVFQVTALLPGYHSFAVPTPTTWSGILAFSVVALVARDGLYYWFHRAQHAWPWLWAQHELHHSDEHMNVTTGGRHHWLDTPFQAVCVLAPMDYLFGMPLTVLVTMQIMGEVIGHFTHADARIHLGRLAAILPGPQFHRIHHSCEPAHLDKNFASVWPFWDVLFGTFYQPATEEFPETGLSSGERITTLHAAALWPFLRWRRMLVSYAHDAVQNLRP